MKLEALSGIKALPCRVQDTCTGTARVPLLVIDAGRPESILTPLW